MAISTVKLNGTTLMTVDDTTTDASEVLSGQYFYAADGTKTQGSIATKTSSDLTANGATVTAPAGYYASAVSKTIASGTAGTPTATKGTVSNHSVSVTPSVTNTTGYITGGTISGTAVTVSASELASGTLSITSNASGINVVGYSAVDVDVPGVDVPVFTLTQDAYGTVLSITCDKTYAQCEQLLENKGNYAAVVRIDPTYTAEDMLYGVCNGYTDYDSTPYALYGPVFRDDGLYDIKYRSNGNIELVSSEFYGEEGTPIATKGAVSNHSITVTPSVVNTRGFIEGNTAITGTPVTVSASELVSGTLSISSSGSAIDVTNYSAVNVPAGSAFTPAKTITVNPSFSLNSSTGVITATASGSSSITPTVNAGYISAGTAGTVSVSGTSAYVLSTQAAQTITPGTSNQTIASGAYLTGTQTILGDANLLSSNIASGVSIFGVNGTFAGGGSVVDVTIPLDFRDLTYNASDGPIVGIMRTGAPTGYNLSANTVTLPQRPYYGDFINGTTYHIKGVFNRVGVGKAYSIDTDFVYSSSVRLTWTEDGTQNTITMSISTTSQHTFGCTFYLDDASQDTYEIWADFTITKVENIDGFRSVSVDRTSSPYLTLLDRSYSGLFSDSLYSSVIGKSAFACCRYLSGVSFAKATAVSEGAFYSNPNLINAYFPSASILSSSAFYGCSNLKTISAVNVSTVGGYCFYSCPKLISVSFPNIPSVPDHTFWGCTKLESVYLPNVKSIGTYAFTNCNALQTFDLSGVSAIASYGFAFCNGLSTLINTSSLTSIGLMAFGSCSTLAGVSADTIVSLGALALNGEGTSAFAYCQNLSYAYFSEVTQVGCMVFLGCHALTDVSIPKLQSIGHGAFTSCTALSNVSFPQLTSISTYGFSNCTFLSGVSFSMLTTLGSNAFHTCTNLSYAYFATLNTIGSNAFRDCLNLTDVSIPLVSVISQSGFYGCQNLSALVLPAASQIQASAFTNCYHLLSLYLPGSSVCALAATNAFVNTPISTYTGSTGGVYGSIFVPASLYNTYKTATNWKTYSARFASLTDAEIAEILS